MTTVKTSNMRIAAVLICSGFAFCESRRLADRGEFVQFTFLCPQERSEEANHLLAACRSKYNVRVHLGEYEAAFRQVREIIETTKECDKDGS